MRCFENAGRAGGEPREPLFSVTPPPPAEAPEAASTKVVEMPATGKPAASAEDETQPVAQALANAAEGDASR